MSLHLGLPASKMGKIAALLSSSRDNFCDFLQQFLHILAGERAECRAASEKYSLIFQHQGKECRHTISILFKYWNTHLHCATVWVNSIYRYEAVLKCTGHDWQDLLSLHELIESDTDPPLASDWSRVITWPGYWPTSVLTPVNQNFRMQSQDQPTLGQVKLRVSSCSRLWPGSAVHYPLFLYKVQFN